MTFYVCIKVHFAVRHVSIAVKLNRKDNSFQIDDTNNTSIQIFDKATCVACCDVTRLCISRTRATYVCEHVHVCVSHEASKPWERKVSNRWTCGAFSRCIHFYDTAIINANSVAERVRKLSIRFSLVVHTYSILSLSIHCDGIRSQVEQGALWVQ